MIEDNPVPEVEDYELLARYIVSSKEFRKIDNTVKPQAFIPYSHVELSVTRHRDATDDELWQIGRDVAKQRSKNLYGRTDIIAYKCREADLTVVPDPLLPENPNHANLIGYPPAKEDQLSIALKIAETASNLIPPP